MSLKVQNCVLEHKHGTDVKTLEKIFLKTFNSVK